MMAALLPLLNQLLPSLLGIYKTVRSEARALDANAPAFTDADLVELLGQESSQTVSKARAILARVDPPTD